MFFYKIYYHLVAFIQKLFFKLIYGSRLNYGKGFQFRKGFSMSIEDGKVNIGEFVFFNNYCTVCSKQSITIGNNTIFGENVKIYDHNHKYVLDNTPIKQQGYSSAPIHIGSNCWIASNVVILKGVTIGDHCIIGAGCIIFKDVPANSVAINKQNLEVKPNL